MLPSRSTKNSAPTLGVDKMFIRQILHVLKDNDLSLNIWFRRRDMGYAKKYIWTHEGPSTKEKNDEHMKAHVLKKGGRKIAMFQNNKL
jgi:hypothetical protein